MYLHNGWRGFTHAHVIEVGHFVVFKYDGHDILTIKVLDEVMCLLHYHSDKDELVRARWRP
jgi:hypothetical protein